MPIYEYRCTACGHELEVMQKVSDPAPDPCPNCGAPKTIERLMSRTSFQLKGGGWYSDLYGSSKPKAKDGGTAGGGEAKATESTKKESAPKDSGSAAASSAPAPAASPSSSEGTKK